MANRENNQIIFILPSLKAGGAERVFSFIAQKLYKKHYNVKLIVLGFRKDKVYELDNLNVKYLNKTRLIKSIPALFNIILKEKPKMVFSSISHVNIVMSIFSIFFKKTKFIGREASVLSEMKNFSTRNTFMRDFLISRLYKFLDLIICQSEDIYLDLKNTYNLNPEKLRIINNPITIKSNYKHVEKNNFDIINFISVGRLSREKGHLRILKALLKIKSYNFKYTIIGSGPELANIKSFCIGNNLLDKIELIPYTNKISYYLSKQDIFLQGSYVEGFPNALLESCTIGVPIIAFNCPGGTKEIIQENINGHLVKNIDEFINILENKDKLLRLNRNKIKDSVIQRFSSEKILLQYENIINERITCE